jgi:hypothetical protein
MALTQIRGAQIQSSSILDDHVASNAAIQYTKLALSGHIVGGDLNADRSVEIKVLQYKPIALWDLVSNAAVSGSSVDVTAAVTGAAATDTVTHDGSVKGVFTTGTASDGTGVANYKVQLRDHTTSDPVDDGTGGQAYAELRNPDSSHYSLYFFNHTGTAFTMGAMAQSDVTCVADVAGSLAGKYFILHTPGDQTPDYFVWYKVGAVGVAPVLGVSNLVGIEVDLTANDTANTVASTTATAIGLAGSGNAYTAVATLAVVRITSKIAGFTDPISESGATMATGFTFTKNSSGSAAYVDFMFLEIFDLDNAPLKGYITGTGFSEIVGVTGSHNHNDLYYSKTELDGGQLDSRYYSQTALQAGAIDTRYYNRSDLNPLASQGANVLDTRFYSIAQIGSTTSSSSGASLVGIENITNLNNGGSTPTQATTVQVALADLQGEVDNIIAGNIDITFSLDEAYDDGATVAVDSANVNWNLTSAKIFQVSDSAGTGHILSLTGGTTYGSFALEANAASTIDAIAANLTVSTTTSGILAVQSAGVLNLKDTNLTNPIPLSQSGTAALNAGFTATSIVGAINELKTQTAGSGSIYIGTPADTTYDDGLIQDWTPTGTLIGTAVDQLNEVMKALAPQPAPALTSASFTQSGVSGKLSFGATNAISGYTNHPSIDKNGAYNVSGNTKGIFNASTAMSGTLANNVVPGYTNSRPYPNNSFANGHLGNLILSVNGTDVKTVDLTTAGAGAALDGNGSGFTLSAATYYKFDNGSNLNVPSLMYRTGTWSVGAAGQRNGYNTVTVRHEYPGTTLYGSTQTFDWVVDAATTGTSYASEDLHTQSMSGANHISGVTYHTSGTAQYDVVISNGYMNTYSSSASAISYQGTRCSASNAAMPTMATEADDVTRTNDSVTISTSSRILNDSITMKVTTDRTVQSDTQSSGDSIGNLLLDATAADSTDVVESFDDESYRMNEAIDTNLSVTTGYATGGGRPTATVWDSTQSLIGSDADHNTGLLISNGKLTYPKVTSHITNITNGNFSAATNGPASNPNYSTASGTRTYIRYFYDAAGRQNFRLNVVATSATFVSVATGVGSNNLTLQILAPNTTQNASAVVEWKDAVTPYISIDDIGCYAATFGNTIPTNWGITLGTRSTITSGHAIVVKITAAAAWTGSIDGITVTWL